MTIRDTFRCLRVAPAFLLAGCAVATIDVDVYKGPLANHKDVQVEQMAAMAVGAKPLLRRLRIVLQDGNDAELVKIVQAVEELYDPSDNTADALFARAKRNFREFDRQLRILDQEHFDSAPKSLKKVVRKLLATETQSYATNKLARAFASFLARKSYDEQHDCRSGSSQSYRNQGRRDRQTIFCVLKDLSTGDLEVPPLLSGDARAFAIPARGDPVYEKRYAANAQFSRLTDYSFLNAHAANLFPDSDVETRELFTAEMHRIAGSYLEARSSLVDLFLSALDGIELVEDLEFGEKTDGFIRQRLQNKLRIALAEFSVSLIREKLLDRIDSGNGTISLSGLEAALRNDNTEAVNIIRETHRALVASNDPSLQFGLVKGPSDISDKAAEISAKLESTIGLVESAGLLSKGRLSQGLMALIDDYLEKSNPDRIGNQPVESESGIARHTLQKALVRFAEKVLFVANHERMFDALRGNDRNVQEIQTYIQVLQTVGNSILVQTDELAQRNSHETRGRDNRDAELAAIRHVFSGGGVGGVYDKMVKSVEDAVATAGSKVKSLSEKALKSKGEFDLATKTAGTAQGNVDAHNSKKPPNPDTTEISRFSDLWRVLGKDPKVLNPGSPPLDPYEIKFGQTVTELAGDPDVTGDALIGKIKEALTDARIRAANSDEVIALNRFTNAVSAIDNSGLAATLPTPRPATGKEMLSALESIIEKIHGEMKIPLVAKIKAHRAWAEKNKELNSALETAKGEVSNAKTKSEMDAGARDAAQANQKASQDALTEMKSRRSSVLSAVSEKDGSAQNAKDALLELLAKAQAAAQGDTATALANATRIVKNLSVPVTIPGGSSDSGLFVGTDPKNVTAVFDELIAVLRSRRLEAISRSGSASTEADNAAAALAEAYRQRSSMIYLRPSMAYLRSSFPSSSLQDDPKLAWENMLQRHSLKSIPVLGGILYNGGSQGEARRQVNAEIDKQFWHNINRVKVSGSGSTDYVIAKDDIGNWYVKSYSGDPKNIIKSARNLALFSLGAQAGTDLLGRLPGPDGASSPQAGGATTLERLFLKHQSRYSDTTVTDLTKLRDLLVDNGIPESILESWDRNSQVADHDNVFKPKLGHVDADGNPVATGTLQKEGAALKEYLENLKKAGTPDAEAIEPLPGRRVVQTLRLLGRYRSETLRSIASVKGDELGDADSDARAKIISAAQSDVTAVIREVILKFASDRRETVAEFERAMGFIGEASKPPPEQPVQTSAVPELPIPVNGN